jgi:hypothetical protein
MSKLEETLAEMTAWLDCGNRSWLDDNLELDIAQGGCAGDFVMSTVKRLMGKMPEMA